VSILAATLKIPHIFRKLINGQKEIPLKPGILTDIFKEVKESYPELAEAILDDKGFVKGYMLLILDKKIINNHEMNTLFIEDEQVLKVIIPMSGG